MARYLILIISIILFNIPLYAVETQNAEQKASPADGIVRLNDHFMIFPDNKPGNSIYVDKRKLLSRDDLTMVDFIEAPEGYIYHGLDKNGNSVLGFTGDPDVKFIQFKGGFYQLITPKSAKKKLYWLNGDRKIEDMLPRRNTGTGLVFNGVDKAAFYHIAKGETVVTEDGRERYQYTFRIHIADLKTHQVRHLPVSVNDFRAKLKLEWMDENTIKYTLDNGQVETIAIR